MIKNTVYKRLVINKNIANIFTVVLVIGIFYLLTQLCFAQGNKTSKELTPFYPNDPLFFYNPSNPLYPGQWNIENKAPSKIDFPKTVAPNGHETAAVTIQNAGLDANIVDAWKMGYTGEGITIGILDDAVQLDHPDLNVDRQSSIGIDDSGINFLQDGGPLNSNEAHGTCVAGMAAAIGGNGIGVCGLAPKAKVAAIKMNNYTSLDDWYTHSTGYYWKAGLNWVNGLDTFGLLNVTNILAAPEIQVKNCSSRTVPFKYNSEANLTYSAAARTSANGVIYTMAAGNNRVSRLQNAGMSIELSNPYVITVAALGCDGKYARYSSFGSPVFATTLSESSFWNPTGTKGVTPYANGFGVSTTDLKGTSGTNYDQNMSTVFLPDVSDTDYTAQFDGTSAASPSLAGMLAVVKQANPILNARMVKHLLARTSRVVDPDDNSKESTWSINGTSYSGWQTNHAGLKFNPNYGFGLPDVTAMVKKALQTAYITDETICATDNMQVPISDQTIVAGDKKGSTETFNVTIPANLKQKLESVEVYLNVQGKDRSEWQITVEKDGVSSCVWAPTNDIPNTGFGFKDDNPDQGFNRLFLANTFWGEDPDGTWKINICNPTGTSNACWNKCGLIFHMGDIVFEQNATATIANEIHTLGFSLNQDGSNVVIDNNGSLKSAGDILINAGTLEVNGSISKNPMITLSKLNENFSDPTEKVYYNRGVKIDIAGGTIKGVGTIISQFGTDCLGGVVNSCGVLSPGNSISSTGVLTIGGDTKVLKTSYKQENGATLEINVNALSDFSRLKVNGIIQLDGKLKVVTKEGLNIKSGDTINSIVTGNAIYGKFSELDTVITGSSPKLYWKPVVGKNAINLVATNYENDTNNISQNNKSFSNKQQINYFIDIGNSWAKDIINESASCGVFTGYSDKTFRPEKSITRAEFTAGLVNGLKLKKTNRVAFADTINNWARYEIATAKQYKITNGYNDNEFGPNDHITREQVALMIANALNLTDNGEPQNYNDSTEISSWARKAVTVASLNKLIVGYDNGSFKPQGQVTRAEAALILMKVLEFKQQNNN